MRRLDVRRTGLALAAPLLALVVSVLLSALVLALVGDPVWSTFSLMADYGARPRSIVNTLDTATTLALAGFAVAIGYRMNLFNIGVDGQYRVAVFCAAAVGGSVSLPGPLLVLLVVLVAVVVGALWASLAALLKVTRGVSEVISSIMLNAIATALVAYLLRTVGTVAGNNLTTTTIPEAAWVPGLALVPGTSDEVYGLVVLVLVVAVVYGVVIGRTRFGFDLRATGASRSAAVASGIDVRRITVTTMLLSGAAAGLVGLPVLLGDSHRYDLNFPAGLGFTGIAIALLGRNHPVGIPVGALLFAYLQTSAQVLALEGISPEIVTIMQGVIVLSVVIAYELVRRSTRASEARRVARALRGAPAGRATEGVGA